MCRSASQPSQQRSRRLLPAKMYWLNGARPMRSAFVQSTQPCARLMPNFNAASMEALSTEVASILIAIMPTPWICSGESSGARRLFPCAQLVAWVFVVFAIYSPRTAPNCLEKSVCLENLLCSILQRMPLASTSSVWRHWWLFVLSPSPRSCRADTTMTV
jgi:hypothetical protein